VTFTVWSTAPVAASSSAVTSSVLPKGSSLLVSIATTGPVGSRAANGAGGRRRRRRASAAGIRCTLTDVRAERKSLLACMVSRVQAGSRAPGGAAAPASTQPRAAGSTRSEAFLITSMVPVPRSVRPCGRSRWEHPLPCHGEVA
jgi:hypothetical protein